MFTHHCIAATLAHDRHHGMRADVGQHRRVRQLRDLAAASRRAGKTPRRRRRTWRPALRLRARAHA